MVAPAEYDAFISSFDMEQPVSVRMNPYKKGEAPFCQERIPWCSEGYYLSSRPSFTLLPVFHGGAFYVQEASSMFLEQLFLQGIFPAIGKDIRVLDLCAAPGGKSTHIASLLGKEGLLVANEVIKPRSKILVENVQKWGTANTMVTNSDPRAFGNLCHFFDVMVVDAPCSGEGMFRKDPKMMKAWEEHGPEFFSRLQRSIVTQAAEMLRPGGMLLYSTCTFDALENEGTIAYLMEKYPEFEICEIRPYEGFTHGRPDCAPGGQADFRKTVRIFPHHMKGEGHYLALLKKGEAKETEGADNGLHSEPSKAKKPLPDDLEMFLKGIKRTFDPGRFDIRGERVYYMPQDLPALSKVRFLRSGLLLGELKKGRFEPSQALAMNLKKEEYSQTIDLPLSDDRVIKYLKGETLLVDDLVGSKEKGWYLVCVDGYPLGFGKLAGGTMKNKYLPGWRWQS